MDVYGGVNYLEVYGADTLGARAEARALLYDNDR